MKHIANTLIVAIMAFVIFMQGLCSGLTIIYFYLNRQYIAENLCENRDKPLMHCNGHCRLKRNLRTMADSPSAPVPKEMKTDIILACDEYAEPTLSLVPNRTSRQVFAAPEKKPDDDFLFEIFKPPTSASLA